MEKINLTQQKEMLTRNRKTW